MLNLDAKYRGINLKKYFKLKYFEDEAKLSIGKSVKRNNSDSSIADVPLGAFLSEELIHLYSCIDAKSK